MDEFQFFDLDESAAQQTINSNQVYAEYRRALEAARPYAGGMYFKKVNGYEYLVKTGSHGRQEPHGKRDERTEAIYAEFHKHKEPREARLKALEAAVVEAERFNKAAGAGRVPRVAVAILKAIEAQGLGQHFTVVGTHALFAYEAAAGVRIVQKALATKDVDLLWDARKRVQFEADMKLVGRSMLSILQDADKTFQRKELDLESAINDKGFQVDFLRRMAETEAEEGSYRLSADEDDLWPVRARRAKILTESPRFEQPVISATGQIALMRTVSPTVFVNFKRWMAEQPDRENDKRQRDRLQAEIVQRLLDEKRLRER